MLIIEVYIMCGFVGFSNLNCDISSAEIVNIKNSTYSQTHNPTYLKTVKKCLLKSRITENIL